MIFDVINKSRYATTIVLNSFEQSLKYAGSLAVPIRAIIIRINIRYVRCFHSFHNFSIPVEIQMVTWETILCKACTEHQDGYSECFEAIRLVQVLRSMVLIVMCQEHHQSNVNNITRHRVPTHSNHSLHLICCNREPNWVLWTGSRQARTPYLNTNR